MTEIGTFIIACYTALLLAVVALCYFFMRRWRWKWVVIAPMLLGVAWLAYAPFAEERDIQARFADLCKDAGVRVVRKVEVEGFYNDLDTTAPGPRTPQASIEFERQGFQYYEFRFSRPYVAGRVATDNSEGRVVHIEKQDGEWKANLLKEPRARFHFKKLRNEEKVGPKIWAREQHAIIDSQNGEIIAREVGYMSLPNKIDLWWISMLGNPLRSCPEYRPVRLPHDVFIPLRKKV